MTHTVLLEILFGLIFGFLALDAFLVLRQVTASLKQFMDFQTQLCKAQMEATATQTRTFTTLGNSFIETSNVLVKHHHDTLQSLALTHESGMDAIKETHGQSAEALRAAASSSADATVEMSQAAQKLNTLLADSNLLSINGHLFALRKFFVGRNEQ